ncbi:ABC transporter ATP-binding protein [Deefgea tanakiae]|uniref:ABC transporter ATP-binding protein n=1 Tax=Deefgea tanakiae TaxID=2865840 RepID=A0ABX8Z858_9NEIS|nr:ABC transporter ATP-binding protein [Deefgea tanakiae]QZA78746.1 ABC transporter ATP-binding protein [Deefgea tanakiae]
MRLMVENLSVRYESKTDSHTAVKGVSLNVGAGQLVVIVGPNGCGKSTLLRAIARLQKPQAGRVQVDGKDVWQLSARQAAHAIALLPQSPLAPEGISVVDLVRYGRHPHQSLFQQWSAYDQDVVERAMAACNVSDLAYRRLDRLSGGQRQRCWLAMILAQEAPLMLLDEPISMLDLGHQLEVLSLAKNLARTGASVVIVLHDLIAAARYADVLVAMQDGHIVAQGAPSDIVTPALVKTLYGVDADILSAPIDGSPVVVPSASQTV